jgi:hypothetical protein
VALRRGAFFAVAWSGLLGFADPAKLPRSPILFLATHHESRVVNLRWSGFESYDM